MSKTYDLKILEIALEEKLKQRQYYIKELNQLNNMYNDLMHKRYLLDREVGELEIAIYKSKEVTL